MKTPIQLEMDSVLDKHILYLTVSLDGLFRFLSHAYFFPLNDTIPITREHSFSYPGHILLTSVQTFIHSMEDQEYQDDLVLVELAIDLSTFPTECVTLVENVWYISYNIPTRLIRK